MIKEFEKMKEINMKEFEAIKEELEFYIPFHYEDGSTIYFISYKNGIQTHIKVR